MLTVHISASVCSVSTCTYVIMWSSLWWADYKESNLVYRSFSIICWHHPKEQNCRFTALLKNDLFMSSPKGQLWGKPLDHGTRLFISACEEIGLKSYVCSDPHALFKVWWIFRDYRKHFQKFVKTVLRSKWANASAYKEWQYFLLSEFSLKGDLSKK